MSPTAVVRLDIGIPEKHGKLFALPIKL